MGGACFRDGEGNESDSSEVENVEVCTERGKNVNVNQAGEGQRTGNGGGLLHGLMARAFRDGGRAMKRESVWVEFISICQLGHCGCGGRNNEYTWQGGWTLARWDTLKPPKGILEVVKAVYEDLFESWEFFVDKAENWLKDGINFWIQADV